jgi:hypothetical protein
MINPSAPGAGPLVAVLNPHAMLNLDIFVLVLKPPALNVLVFFSAVMLYHVA